MEAPVTSIRTTHTGSLPRPDALVESIMEREQRGSAPGFDELAAASVRDVVQQQVDVGIDVINDGEMPRLGFASYVKDRLGGFKGEDEGGFANTDVADQRRAR